MDENLLYYVFPMKLLTICCIRARFSGCCQENFALFLSNRKLFSYSNILLTKVFLYYNVEYGSKKLILILRDIIHGMLNLHI